MSGLQKAAVVLLNARLKRRVGILESELRSDAESQSATKNPAAATAGQFKGTFRSCQRYQLPAE